LIIILIVVVAIIVVLSYYACFRSDKRELKEFTDKHEPQMTTLKLDDGASKTDAVLQDIYSNGTVHSYTCTAGLNEKCDNEGKNVEVTL